jgi:hypothetical protein
VYRSRNRAGSHEGEDGGEVSHAARPL